MKYKKGEQFIWQYRPGQPRYLVTIKTRHRNGSYVVLWQAIRTSGGLTDYKGTSDYVVERDLDNYCVPYTVFEAL